MNDEAASHHQSPSLARRNRAAASKRASIRGYSMTEVVMVISIIGVLAGIAMPKFASVTLGTQEALANEKMEMLNQAINDWGHASKEYIRTPDVSLYSDELTILNDLEYRDPNPNKTLTGSPYVRPDYRPAGSSSTDDFRIMWTGSRFKLLRPGTSGSGIKVVFDGSDYGTPFAYPPGYSSWGS